MMKLTISSDSTAGFHHDFLLLNNLALLLKHVASNGLAPLTNNDQLVASTFHIIIVLFFEPRR